VPVHIIANVSVIGFLPSSVAFVLCPILDVRFTRRVYLIATAIASAACLGGAVLELHHLVAFTTLMTLGCVGAVFYGNALGGWQVDTLHTDDFGWLGAWVNIANLGAAGSFGTLSIHIIRTLPPMAAAVVIGCIVLLPLVLLLWFPEPMQPTRTAVETFRSLFHDIYHLMKQRAVLLGLAAFLLPESCFGLSNLFSGLGADFHATESYMATMSGVGVAVACSIGTLAGGWLCSRYARGYVYAGIGVGGALCTVGMIFVPHTEMSFTVGMLMYCFFQGINFVGFTSFTLDLTGKNNPLAATQISVLTAAANVPILYMAFLDGHAHDRWGVNGMLAVDAIATVVFAAIVLTLFRRFHVGRGELVHPDAAIAEA
jgi:PAT family beta-lactamase induction signal transducer AmpG